MTALPSCPRCGQALTACPACGAQMRAGLCQVSGKDARGRLVMTEEFYCPSGCDADGRFRAARDRWIGEHTCPPEPQDR